METIHFQDNIDLYVLYAKLEALITKRHGYISENFAREQNGYSLAYSCNDFFRFIRSNVRNC
jgi:hypothetical protein